MGDAFRENASAISEKGQSLWYDNVSRELIEDGSLSQLIGRGISGLTSNPSIFEKAIAHSNAYDENLAQLVSRDSDITASACIDQLMAEDIAQVCDLLSEVYESSGKRDGFASIEVSPLLAGDAEGTVEAAEHLHAAVNRPNVMIKIPATEECMEAIEEVLYRGISVNVTLIFSLAQYQSVIARHQAAIRRRLKEGLDCSTVASVASFFVSRVDSACDKVVDKHAELRHLRGQLALANCSLAYQLFLKSYQGSGEFAELAHNGNAQVQRPLWASTSVKDPAYSALKYVTPLALPQTVNTLPHVTVEALEQTSMVSDDLLVAPETAHALLAEFSAVQSFDAVLGDLLREGVAAFESSFRSLEQTIVGRLQKG